jgi:hypothetical protein
VPHPNLGGALSLLPIDHGGGVGATATPTPNATSGHNTPSSSLSSTASAARRRNLESSFAAVAATLAPAINSAIEGETLLPSSARLETLKAECRSDADDDYDLLFCSVDIDSLVAEAKAGPSSDEAPVLPSPILPLSTRQYTHVSSSPSSSSSSTPSPLSVVAPPQFQRDDDSNGGEALVLGFSPPRVRTSSAFSPSNGALSFCPSPIAVAALPPPSPPPRSSEGMEELIASDEDNHNIDGDDDDADDDDGDDNSNEEEDEEDIDGKANGQGACSLLDELFPENSQQRRKRAKQESWHRWLIGFHPPGVPVPSLPHEILHHVPSDTTPTRTCACVPRGESA